jgi:hypothetical protein
MSRRVTLAVLSDSLGLPRATPAMVTPKQTWPVLLRAAGGVDVVDVVAGREAIAVEDVVHIGIGGATVHQLQSQLGYGTACAPNAVVVQCGIVDCAPRALRRWERDALARVPGGKRVAKLVENNARQLRAWRDVAFTPPEAFAAAVTAMRDKAQPAPLLWVGIAPASADYERAVPGIQARVQRYNALLSRVLGDRYVDVDGLLGVADGGLCADHHHLTAGGHAFVAQRVRSRLNEVLR